MHTKTVAKITNQIKDEFSKLGREGKRSFLFVYCAGHGVADQ